MASTSVNCAAIKLSVSIHVQKPLPCAWSEDTNPHLSYAVPIADNGEITTTTKLAYAPVYTVPVPLAITIDVSEPLSGAWSKEANFFRAQTVPVANDGQIAHPTKVLVTFIGGAAVQLVIRIEVKFKVREQVGLQDIDVV